MTNDAFWPEIEPYETGRLDVGDPHVLYWEQVGNPDGEPVLFVHGGPGMGCTPTDRRFFDPEHFRIVLVDQRGSGRSTPVGEIRDNTIDRLVDDIEALRQQLGIDRWHVFGGSWGSTLGLYYAQTHPERTSSLVVRGIWMLRPEELEWWLYTMRFVQPERWDAFAQHIPVDERGDLLDAYWRRLTSPDQSVALSAAKAWSIYEGASCTLVPNPEFEQLFDDADTALSVARLEALYFRECRFEPEDRLLRDIDSIRNIPAVIVHGRYDIICPVKNALDLHNAWPEASLVIVDDAGHSSHEPGITQALVAAMERIKACGSPVIG